MGKPRVSLGICALALVGSCGRTSIQPLSHECESPGIPSLACEQTDPCSGESVAIEAESPEILIQLDRSCSMEPRWVTAVTALADVLDIHGSEAHWGLSVFPDREFTQCVQGELLMPIRDDSAQAVSETLLSSLDPRHEAYPNGPCLTNLAAAIGQIGTEPAFAEGTEQRIALLITDGWQTCGGRPADEGAVDIIRRLHDERGIATYIVSFAGEVDATALTELAEAGGTARDEEPAYYLSSGEDLDAILDEIVGGLRCIYTLDVAAQDVARLRVVLDGLQTIEPGVHDGWSYDLDAKTLRFHGATCERLIADGGTVEFQLACG